MPPKQNQQASSRPFFMRLPQVLAEIPVSKSTWWAGVREGRFPKPVKLSKRTTAWRRTDIDNLCDRLSEAANHG